MDPGFGVLKRQNINLFAHTHNVANIGLLKKNWPDMKRTEQVVVHHNGRRYQIVAIHHFTHSRVSAISLFGFHATRVNSRLHIRQSFLEHMVPRIVKTGVLVTTMPSMSLAHATEMYTLFHIFYAIILYAKNEIHPSRTVCVIMAFRLFGWLSTFVAIIKKRKWS